MAHGRIPGRYAGLLNELVDRSDVLTMERGSARARTKHEVPVDEFNLPVRQALFDRAISSVGGITTWRGYFDVHHIGWPYSSYRALSTDDFESVGEAYRDLGAVKVRVPRQLHEYFHIAFECPPIPDEGVMVQFLAEEVQIRKLLAVLNPTRQEHQEKIIDPTLKLGRYARYLDLVDTMPPPEVKHLPELAQLIQLSAEDAQRALLGKISILRYWAM